MTRFEIFANLVHHSVIIPENANAIDSFYYMLNGNGLEVTTDEQIAIGHDHYRINYPGVMIKQVMKAELDPTDPSTFFVKRNF